MTPDFDRQHEPRHHPDQGEQVNHTEPPAKTQSHRTGLFATLHGLLPASGSGAPAVRRLAGVLTLSIAALLTLGAGPALAAPPTLIPDGQLHSKTPLGVAVDNSTGDAYVAGFFSFSEAEGIHLGEVNKYDPSGNLLSPPSPFGVPTNFFEKGSGYSGAAVDPVNGDLYVLDALFSEIDVFSPSGALESSFPVPASANFPFLAEWTVVGIAADSAGNVYVPVVPEDKVVEYSPAGAELATFTGGSGSGALSAPTGVALDPAGNLWVADTGNSRLEQLSPADAPLAEIPVEGTLQSLAVDAHAHLFAIVKNSADFCGSLEPPCSHLLEYTAAGAPLIDLGAGEFGGGSTNEPELLPDMVAVNDTSGRLYVTDPFNSRVLIYTPPTPPQIESELAVGITTSEAKLGALLNPGGIGTSYRFEYGTTPAYGQTAPTPEGDAGTGLRSRTVWASPSGLQPGTTYHYRAVVANELGEVKGPDKTFTTATAAGAACPNDQFRSGFSAALPDCRAYELLTPPNKSSAQPDKDKGGNGPGDTKITQTLANNFATPDGNRFQFRGEDVFPGSQSAGEAYLATRGPAGWSYEDQMPPQNYYLRGSCPEGFPTAHSEDASKAIISATSGGICGLEPELIGGEPRGTQNLFLRDNATGAYQLINLTPPGVTPTNAEFLAASPDLGRVVFTEQAPLTPEALPGVDNLYEWSAGQVHFVTLLPQTETPVTGSFKATSADGSHVFFTAAGNLYARVDGAETLQLDASQAAGPGGGGHFLAAGSDGSQVLFTDDASAALTADTQPGSATNLYLYDSTAPAGQRLTDLTPVAAAGAPELAGISTDGSQVVFTDDASAALTADTQPGSGTNLYRFAAGQLTDLSAAAHSEVQQVLAVSEDGSSVYFEAQGVLTAEPNQHGETAQSGQPNLYLSHAGATTFIADAAAGPPFGGIKVSANGAFLALESNRRLTAYDNTDPNTAQPADELYLYAAAANSLTCASCNPSGEPPTSLEGVAVQQRTAFEFDLFRHARNLTENGRLFFNDTEALLPSDTNGAGGCQAYTGIPSCTDVYEFEPAGVGTCTEPAGCLFLISTGTGSRETLFIDASANGNDVFLREFQALVPSANQEDATSIYDVRVDGGFPEPGSPPPCTTADSCRPSPQPQPSIAAAPSSATFSGAGNEKPKPKKHHKKHKAKKHHKRAASHKRGGGK